jgi:hypothetical protein
VAILSVVVVFAVSARAAAQGDMKNYLGQLAAVPKSELGARAKFIDGSFTPVPADTAKGVELWQSPLPGKPFGAGEAATFLVSEQTPMPEIVGWRVADAETFLSYRGLMLSVVSACSQQGHGPYEEELDQQVSQQCVAPGTLLDVGNHVGVVIMPWPESVAFYVAVAIAVLAALAALAFFRRLQAKRTTPT